MQQFTCHNRGQHWNTHCITNGTNTCKTVILVTQIPFRETLQCAIFWYQSSTINALSTAGGEAAFCSKRQKMQWNMCGNTLRILNIDIRIPTSARWRCPVIGKASNFIMHFWIEHITAQCHFIRQYILLIGETVAIPSNAQQLRSIRCRCTEINDVTKLPSPMKFRNVGRASTTSFPSSDISSRTTLRNAKVQAIVNMDVHLPSCRQCVSQFFENSVHWLYTIRLHLHETNHIFNDEGLEPAPR